MTTTNTNTTATITTTSSISPQTTPTTTTSTTTTTSVVEDYFSFALNHSSMIKVLGKDDYIYGDYYIPGGISVYNHTFSAFSISNDGRMNLRSARGFSLIIKPFDSDIDLRANGAILHGRVERADLLEAIGSDIRSKCSRTSFKPNWAYVVTWYEARPYYRHLGDAFYGAKSNYTNTFQALIATDNTEFFAIYNYINMNWPNSFIDSPFESGFSTWDITFRTTSVYFETKEIRNLLEKTNMNKPGRWLISFNNTNCLL